jgi:putative phosphoesterase
MASATGPKMTATAMPFEGITVAVLADCHIHPGGGPEFPQALLDALAGVDLIITLGDMGESAGLDQLEALAPVAGVRGQDDAEDRRTAREALVLNSGQLDIGCIFDAVATGLATSADPFEEAPDAAAVSKRLFGMHVDLLLYAGTHRPGGGKFGPRGMSLNPGSAVLPAEGAEPTFARIVVSKDSDAWFGEVVPVR